jgi:Na+/phosphate symporter
METLHRSLFGSQQKIAESMDDLYQKVSLTYQGFMKHKRSALREAENLGKKVRHFEKTFGEAIVKEGNKEGVRVLVALPGHLARIADCLESAVRAVETKIQEGTLFSDKAVSEASFVFTTARDMVRDTRDVVLTGNPVLLAHVLSVHDTLSQAAQDFMTAHQERLINGVCQPKHSSIFLDIVDNLRNAGWHLREIVTKLQG